MSAIDLTGLNDFSELLKTGSEVASAASAAAASGKPLLLAVSVIHEDPDQPRREFVQEKLQDLADSIKARGVKTPISVRPHPTEAGQYIINHGARRYRASVLAGKTEVPAFVDDSHDDIDQLAENIQRDDLSVREIVDAIGRKLARGLKQVEIAQELGKSRAWVSKHAALTDLPEELAELLASGQCRDASTLYEALQVWKASPDAVIELIIEAGDRQIVQADIENLRAKLRRDAQPDPEPIDEDAPVVNTQPGQLGSADEAETAAGATTSPVQADLAGSSGQDAEDTQSGPAGALAGSGEGGNGLSVLDAPTDSGNDHGGDGDGQRQQSVKPSAPPVDPMKVRKPLVQVRVGRREGVMIIGKKAEYGLAWVQFENGEEEQLDVNKVKLVAITDGAAK